MHSYLPIAAVLLTLSVGCAHNVAMPQTPGSGKLGQFILTQGERYGARPINSLDLTDFETHWTYFRDDDGINIHLPKEHFEPTVELLRRIYGPPHQEPLETSDGRLGWYHTRTIGAGILFGHTPKETHVSILRRQPNHVVYGLMIDALQDDEP